MDTSNLSLGFAFLAGLASFLSPCVFSLVPAYIGYLGGRSIASSDREGTGRWQVLSHGLAFVLGFSLVFILLGLGASALGQLLFDLKPYLMKIGGIAVVVFGVHMTGLIRIPFLQYDLRYQTPPARRLNYLSSALMGVFFSAGWSPCTGPILGSILTISSLGGGPVTRGALLLSAYSAGLAVPFLLAATQIGLVTTLIRRYGRVMHFVEVGMGLILILVGALLFTGRFEQLANLGSFFAFYDEISVGRFLLLGLVALAVIGFIPAILAVRKGRRLFDWWLFGVAIFPVALLAAIFLTKKTQESSEKAIAVESIHP
jgi:cytochrome c-type biogenesis protein